MQDDDDATAQLQTLRWPHGQISQQNFRRVQTK